MTDHCSPGCPLPALDFTPIVKNTPTRDSWANREESTWIDQM